MAEGCGNRPMNVVLPGSWEVSDGGSVGHLSRNLVLFTVKRSDGQVAKDGTTWYYMNSSGAMLTGCPINGSWHYLHENERWQKTPGLILLCQLIRCMDTGCCSEPVDSFR